MRHRADIARLSDDETPCKIRPDSRHWSNPRPPYQHPTRLHDQQPKVKSRLTRACKNSVLVAFHAAVIPRAVEAIAAKISSALPVTSTRHTTFRRCDQDICGTCASTRIGDTLNLCVKVLEDNLSLRWRCRTTLRHGPLVCGSDGLALGERKTTATQGFNSPFEQSAAGAVGALLETPEEPMKWISASPAEASAHPEAEQRAGAKQDNAADQTLDRIADNATNQEGKPRRHLQVEEHMIRKAFARSQPAWHLGNAIRQTAQIEFTVAHKTLL